MRVRLAGIAALALLLGGCATSDDEFARRPRPSVAAGEFGEQDCFLWQTLRNFEVLDDHNLIVFAAGEAEAYHVQVSPPATGLRFAGTLAFESRSARVCGHAGDALIVHDSGLGPQRLGVIGVFRLDETALAGLRARFGLGSARPAGGKPQPGPGAALERDLGDEDGP